MKEYSPYVIPDYDVVQELFSDLLLHYRSSFSSERTPFIGTILDLPLEETLEVMPTLPNKVIVNIAQQAARGDLGAMFTISKMYTVGLGLPRSTKLAYCWAQHSLNEIGTIDYTLAVKKLRTHLEALDKSDYSYPSILDKIYKSMTPHYENIDGSELPSGNYYVTPMLAGVRAFLIYRVHKDKDGSVCYLYDVRVGGEQGDRLSLDVAHKLNVPFVLGTIRNRATIPDYIARTNEYLEGPTNYITIAGTLVIPNSKKPLIREALPSVKKASELFNYLITAEGKDRFPYEDTKEFTDLNDKIKRVKERIASIEDGSLVADLRTRYNHIKSRYERARRCRDVSKMKEYKEEANEIKAENDKIKSSAYLTYLKTGIKNILSESEPIIEENSNLRKLHEARYPENLFDFIATDIYSGSKGHTNPVPIGAFIYRHLESLGFKSFTNSMLDTYSCKTVKTKASSKGISPRAIKSKVNQFKSQFKEYKVTGLIFRSAFPKTVNSKKDTDCLAYNVEYRP